MNTISEVRSLYTLQLALNGGFVTIFHVEYFLIKMSAPSNKKKLKQTTIKDYFEVEKKIITTVTMSTQILTLNVCFLKWSVLMLLMTKIVILMTLCQ